MPVLRLLAFVAGEAALNGFKLLNEGKIEVPAALGLFELLNILVAVFATFVIAPVAAFVTALTTPTTGLICAGGATTLISLLHQDTKIKDASGFKNLQESQAFVVSYVPKKPPHSHPNGYHPGPGSDKQCQIPTRTEVFLWHPFFHHIHLRPFQLHLH